MRGLRYTIPARIIWAAKFVATAASLEEGIEARDTIHGTEFRNINLNAIIQSGRSFGSVAQSGLRR